MYGFLNLLRSIQEFIEDTIECVESMPSGSYAEIELKFDGIKAKGEITMAELREGQQVTATLNLKTRGGRAAAYEVGTAVWETSNPDVATVTANPDNELEAVIKGVDGTANEPAVISFRADGDPDADQTREIVATVDVVVTRGEAFVAELGLGTASDVPEETAPTEPTPAEPAPTEPTEPTPTEPAPEEPTPTEPTPAEPAPTEPAEPTAPVEPTEGETTNNPEVNNVTDTGFTESPKFDTEGNIISEDND